MLHQILTIEEVIPFSIRLRFNTGESKTIDLKKRLISWSMSEGSRFKDLLNPDYFKTVELNSDLGTIVWDNGIDFCPDTLYSWAGKE